MSGVAAALGRSPRETPAGGDEGRMQQRSSVVAVVTAVLLALLPWSGSALAAPSGLSGPDVASYQHPSGAPIDWNAVRASGQRWAFVKATEGTTYTNPYFAADWHDSAAAGLYHGAYHFARPSSQSGSASAQAQAFASAIGPQQVPGTLPPILDLEQSGGLAPADLVTWTHEFLNAVQTDTGRLPMLYTYPNFWQNQMAGSAEFTAYPLWVASYGTSSAPTLGWSHWTFWQYTSSGTVDGIQTQGATDLSVFNGTSLDLAALASAGSWGPATSTASDSSSGTGNLSRAPVQSTYAAVPAQRFVDTRSGRGAPAGPVAGTVTVTVPSSVPADATGVVLDVSAVDPRGTGWLRVAPAGSTPTTTALNYTASHGVTGLVVTATNTQRQVDVSTYAGATDLTIDVVGYYTASAQTGGHWSPMAPARVVDTRSGTGAPAGPVSGSVTFTLPSSVPQDAAGVVLDVTAVNPSADGYLRLAPAGHAPTTTALNFQGGGSTTGLAITTATNNQVTVTVAGAPATLVVDLVGYYEGNAASGSQYVAVTPQRFLDTRSGLGAQGPGLGPLSVTVPGIVPRDATAVILDVSVVGAVGNAFVRLAAPGTPAVTTAVNAVAHQSRTGLVITGLRDGQITLASYGSNSDLVIDLVGYQTTTAPPSPSPTASATPTGGTASPTPTAASSTTPRPTASPSPSP
ncbi:MAG: hypothetical protein NVSMB55_25630 [Mycobacteriales bacterium]